MNIDELIINKLTLFNLIKSIENPSLKKHDMMKKIFIKSLEREVSLEYYTWTVWEKILKDKSMIGTAINKYEWNNYFKEYSSDNVLLTNLFNKLNNKSKSINYEEFLNFFISLDKNDIDIFCSVLEKNTVQNPLVDLDLEDTVIIDIKEPKKPKCKKPISKEPIKDSTESKPPFNIDKDHGNEPRKNYCDRFQLFLLNIKIMFINVKNKITNSLYGIF